jgi:sugar lactone lactonase YvrE
MLSCRIVRLLIGGVGILTAACGGSKATAPTPGATLIITVTQPPGARPLIVISGPTTNNLLYAAEVLGTDTLRGLAAGTYRVVSATATTVDPIATPTDTGNILGDSLTLAVNDTGRVTVTFSARPGAGDLWVFGGSAGHGTAVGYTSGELLAQSAPGLTLSVADAYAVFDTSGNLWVASPGTNTVSEYTLAQLVGGGTPTPATTISGGALSGPDGLAFDRLAGLWVANGTGNTLVHYTAAQLQAGGSPAPDVVLSSTALQHPGLLAFDVYGKLWVPNAGNNTVVAFSANALGATATVSPATTLSAAAGSLSSPQSLAFDQPGNLWVANGASATIVVYSYTQQLSGGGLTPTVTYTLPANLGSPSAIAFDNSGDLWGLSVAGSSLFEYSAAQIGTGGATAPAAMLAVGANPHTIALDPVPDGYPISGPHVVPTGRLRGPGRTGQGTTSPSSLSRSEIRTPRVTGAGAR